MRTVHLLDRKTMEADGVVRDVEKAAGGGDDFGKRWDKMVARR